MLACLSTNGDVVTTSAARADTLLVASVGGLVRLRRSAVGVWKVEDHLLQGTHPSAIIKDPASGQLFCGLHYEGGVMASSDDGRTWTPLSSGLESGHVYTLTRQTIGDRTVLYAGVEPPMLYRSDNLGESWRKLDSIWRVPDTDQWRFPPPPHIAHLKNVAFHPAEPETLYICIEQGDVLKTTDGGVSWRPLTGYSKASDQFRRDVHRIIIRPSNPEQLYLASGVGLYYSEDGGEHWEHLTKGDFRVGYPDCLFFDPKDEQTLFMAGASRAPNPSWRELRSANPGILRSRNGGRDWEALHQGLPDLVLGNIEAMAAHQSDAGLALFAGTAVGEIWGSENGGETWSLLADNLPPISKGAHYRHFATPEARDEIEKQLKRSAA